MQKIHTIQELEQLADTDGFVWDTLIGTEGRRRAADALESHGYKVSEKLIRTWRDNAVDQALRTAHAAQKAAEQMSSKASFNPVKYPPVPMPSYDPYAISSKETWDRISFDGPLFVEPKQKKAKDDQRVIAFGDFQINKHDPELLSKAVSFVEDQQPDIICLTGDESDNSAVGRWARGMQEEFESNLQAQIDETIDWLTDIREAAPNARIYMAHSNHMNWITKAIETRLPGFQTLRALLPENLYDLDALEIEYKRELFEFLPNFLLGHGHQWELTSKSHRSKGIEQVMRTGCSILAGHVHQAALETVFIGYEGKGEQKVYVNPGCMMDFSKAMESNGGYISGTSPNWSKGIAVITREAGQNYTELILAQNDGTFRYEGEIY